MSRSPRVTSAITALAGALLVCAAADQASAQAPAAAPSPRGLAVDRSQRVIGTWPVRTTDANSVLVSIGPASPNGPAVLNLSSTLYTFQTIDVNGFEERFMFFDPGRSFVGEKPLVVFFHSANRSAFEVVSTGLAEECQQRGWYLLAANQTNTCCPGPGGAPADVNYGSAQSQTHMEAVLNIVAPPDSPIRPLIEVDPLRIYGIGFSMGGGSAMSFAARHRDPDSAAFAAVVNHTGTVALSYEWEHAPPPANSSTLGVRAIMEAIFGDDPIDTPFPYQQSSTVELSPLTGALVPGGKHMAQNLLHVSVLSHYHVADRPTWIDQTLGLDQFMDTARPGSHTLWTSSAAPPPPCNGAHCWQTLDVTAACDWFTQQPPLDPAPPSGEFLIDRGDPAIGGVTWGPLTVTTDVQGKFARVAYDASAPGDLTLAGDDNVDVVSLRLEDLQLDAGGVLRVVSTIPGAHEILLTDVPAKPTLITHSGAPTPTTFWSATDGLRLTSPGVTGVWTITP